MSHQAADSVCLTVQCIIMKCLVPESPFSDVAMYTLYIDNLLPWTDIALTCAAGASGSTTAAAASFYRTTNLLPGTGRRGIVLALAQGEQRARTFTIVRPNTGRQPKPWTKEQFTSK